MRLAFPYTLTLLPDDRYEVRFPDFDVRTAAATAGEALDEAAPLLIDALEERIKAGRTDLFPTPRAGESLFFTGILLSVKVLLNQRCRETKIGAAELGRRMGLRPQETARILDLEHATRIDTMEKALAAVGLELEFTVKPKEDWDPTPYR